MLVRDHGSQAPKGLAYLGNPGTISLSEDPSLDIELPRYLKFSTTLSSVPSMEMVGESAVVRGDG